MGVSRDPLRIRRHHGSGPQDPLGHAATARIGWTQLNLDFGDGGHMVMTRAIRAHANFAELVPFTMFLFGLCELDGALPGPVLHAIGLVLFFSRLLHYYGTGLEGTPTNCRVFGTVGCVSSLSILGLSLIRYGLLHH